VSPSTLEFGNVHLGDTKTISLKITNVGAIPTSFEISVPDSTLDLRSNIVLSSTLGNVLGHSSVTVDVAFKPSVLRAFQDQLIIKYSDKNLEPFSLPIQVSIVVLI
jgi:hypothetical protein